MKHFFKSLRLVVCLLLCVVGGVGNVWGDTTVTLTFSGREVKTTGTSSTQSVDVNSDNSAFSGTLYSYSIYTGQALPAVEENKQSSSSVIDMGQTCENATSSYSATNPTLVFKLTGMSGKKVTGIKFYYKVTKGDGNYQTDGSGMVFDFSCKKGSSSNNLVSYGSDVSFTYGGTTSAYTIEYGAQFTGTSISAESDDMYFSFTAGRTLSSSSHAGCFLVVTKIEITLASYTVSLGSCTNGSIAFSDGTTAAKTVWDGSSVTVNATPDTGYALDKWKVGDTEQSETSTTFTYTPTAGCTISATFSEMSTLEKINAAVGDPTKVIRLKKTNADYYFNGYGNKVSSSSDAAQYRLIAVEGCTDSNGNKGFELQNISDNSFITFTTSAPSTDGDAVMNSNNQGTTPAIFFAVTTQTSSSSNTVDRTVNGQTATFKDYCSTSSYTNSIRLSCRFGNTSSGTEAHLNSTNNANPPSYGGCDKSAEATIWYVEFTTVDYTLSVGTTGYSTLCLPYDATVPANAYLYRASENGESKITLNKLSNITVLPANTGVVVKADEGTYTFAKSSTAATALTGTNILTGTTKVTSMTANSYALSVSSSDASKAVFKQVSGKIAPYKAYIDANTLSSARAQVLSIDWGDDETTGVINIGESESSMQDGKFIQDGNFVIVRNGKRYNANGIMIK